jgi:MFS family permease
VLSNYRAVFREPGTASFCLAGLVMRMPIAMYPIGLVLIISSRTGHYGFAGVLSATYVFGAVPGNPLLARLTDRHGQSRTVLPASALHALAIVIIGVLLETRAPLWTLVPPTFVMGFAFMSVASLVRARWSYVLDGRPELSTAFSLESTLDEVVFVLGPLIATLIATQLDAVGVLVLGVLLVCVGACWLASLTATEPPAHVADGQPHPSALRARGMPLLLLSSVAMGGIFAGAEVTMIAFCGQHHERAASGVVLACFAFGSGVSGFVYGARSWHSDLLARFRVHSAVFALLPLLFLAAVNVPVLAVCAFVAGLGIAPTLITAFGLVGRFVPAGALTEGLAWLTTGISVGYGIASASVGKLADAFGARNAFWVPIGAGLLMGLCAMLLDRRRPSRQRDESQAVVVGAE